MFSGPAPAEPSVLPGLRVAPLFKVVVLAPTVPLPASVAPELTTRGPVSTLLLAALRPMSSVPPLTVVLPEKLLVGPLRVSTPVPSLMRPPVPLIVPL